MNRVKMELEFIDISNKKPMDPEWGEFITFSIKKKETPQKEKNNGSDLKHFNHDDL
jgi:hypothetical protein